MGIVALYILSTIGYLLHSLRVQNEAGVGVNFFQYLKGKWLLYTWPGGTRPPVMAAHLSVSRRLSAPLTGNQ